MPLQGAAHVPDLSVCAIALPEGERDRSRAAPEECFYLA
jgi:hypothetical protein